MHVQGIPQTLERQSRQAREALVKGLSRSLLELDQHMRRPRQHMQFDKFPQNRGLMTRDPRRKQEQRAYMVFWSLAGILTRNPVSPHPRAQLERRLPEHHTFAVGIHRPPRRRGHGVRPDEKPSVLPSTFGALAPRDHGAKTRRRLVGNDEGPRLRRGIRVKRSDGIECRGYRLVIGIDQKKRTQHRCEKRRVVVTLEHHFPFATSSRAATARRRGPAKISTSRWTSARHRTKNARGRPRPMPRTMRPPKKPSHSSCRSMRPP